MRKPRPLPFVFINMAITADGKIATATRAVSSFGSRRDKEHLFELRATADAVMAGARTVDLNPVNLGPGPAKYRRQRIRHGLREYNLRIIVSRSGSVNPDAGIFKQRFSPIIILTTASAGQSRLKKLRTLADEVKICGANDINLPRALRWLRKKWNIQRLLSEGGGELDGALFRAGLVDELHLTLCPKIFGGRSAPTIAEGVGAARIADAATFTIKSARRYGDELFLVFSSAQRASSHNKSERRFK